MDFGIFRGFWVSSQGFWANSPCTPDNCTLVCSVHSQVLGFHMTHMCFLPSAFWPWHFAAQSPEIVVRMLTQTLCDHCENTYPSGTLSPPQPPASQPFVITFRWQNPNILFQPSNFFELLFYIGVQPVNDVVIISGNQRKGLNHTCTYIQTPLPSLKAGT